MTRYRYIHRFLLLLAGAVGFAQTPDRVALLASCDDSNDIKATVRMTDTVQVHSSLAESGQECFSVSATIDGQVVRGYILGDRHPAILDYERVRAKQPVIMPYVPPPAAPAEDAKDAKAPAEPATPQPANLAGLRGVDYNGRPVDIDRMKAKTVIVYFWSPNNRRLAKDTEGLDYIYEQYQPSGVEIVGVAGGSTPGAVRQFCEQNEAVWPQVIDSGKLAQQYHVDPAKPYLVLDQERNVVAALSSATQLDTVLHKRLKGTL